MGDPSGDLTDGDIIRCSLAAPGQFRAIVDRHFAVIYRYLARRVGRDHAEDLAAECFAAAFRTRGSFQLERGNARPYGRGRPGGQAGTP
ncbi:MAG: RNA polymerase sigma factor [Actinomycetota bacterium]